MRRNENHEELLLLVLVILIISDKATLFPFMNERSSDSSIYDHKKGERWRETSLYKQQRIEVGKRGRLISRTYCTVQMTLQSLGYGMD